MKNADDMSRAELFAMFRINEDALKIFASSDEEMDRVMDFVENMMRKIAEEIDESPTFSPLWRMKEIALPFTKASAEVEYHNDDYEGNAYKEFTNQLGTDVTFMVWLLYSITLLVARYITTLQFIYGDKLKEGSDKDWFIEVMNDAHETLIKPFINSLTNFMVGIDYNSENLEMNDLASRTTAEFFGSIIQDSQRDLQEPYLETLDLVFQKIAGLYMESIVNFDESEN